MRNKNIPTKEDFARAAAMDEYEHRGLSDTCKLIKNKYKNDDVIQAFMFYSPSNNRGQ